MSSITLLVDSRLQVVYVTAILPYVLLIAFLVRGLTLPGAMTGLTYYLTPDFNRLLDSQVCSFFLFVFILSEFLKKMLPIKRQLNCSCNILSFL